MSFPHGGNPLSLDIQARLPRTSEMAVHSISLLWKEHRVLVESTCVTGGNVDSEHVRLAFDTEFHC